MLGLGGGGYVFFLGGKPDDAAKEVAVKKPVGFIEVREMTVNLAPESAEDRARLLRFKVSLEVKDPKATPDIQPLLPRVEDSLQVYVRELRASDLDGSAGSTGCAKNSCVASTSPSIRPRSTLSSSRTSSSSKGRARGGRAHTWPRATKVWTTIGPPRLPSRASRSRLPRGEGGGGEGGDGSLADEWGAALAEQGASGKAEDMAAEWATMIDEGVSDDSPDLAGADRILNQDEIDQLIGFSLHELSASGAGGIRAIVDSGVVSYERLPMLEIIFDRMIRLLSTSLRNFFQDNVEVTLDNITSVRFGDYLNSIPLPVQLAVFRAEGWDNSGLVTVESNLAYSTLDLLLGGKRGGTATRLDGRPFTTIEMQLIKRMVEIVLGDAELSFQPLSPVRFIVDRMERIRASPRSRGLRTRPS